MITFGYEREYFVRDDKDEAYCLATEIAHDDCNVLAEARSTPSSNLVESIYLLKAACVTLSNQARAHRLRLSPEREVVLPRELILEAMRGNLSKNYEEYSLYGKYYRFNPYRVRAGLHIHFSATTTDSHGVKETRVLDIPQIIRYLDNVAFKHVIHGSKRLPGMYALKPAHHGFEYRSLPATISDEHLLEGLQMLQDSKILWRMA